MKKFKIEYLIYIFILISPILDAGSYLLKTYVPQMKISLTMILRPIIPIVLLLYIFIKEKKYRKGLILGTLFLLGYGVIHLLISKSLFYGISYGTLSEELSYVINYSYNIYLLFIIYHFEKNGYLKKINKYMFLMLIEYLIIIYFSIFTKTSFTTYVEGMGYRSYFLSGNSISTILLLLLCNLMGSMNEVSTRDKIAMYFSWFILGVYLVFLVGTRTGMLGFILLVLLYGGSSLLFKFIKDKKVNLKKLILSLSIVLIILLLVSIGGSETLKRRKHIDEAVYIIDVNTNEPGFTTGDTGVIVWQIKNLELKKDYMSEEMKKAYLDLYNYANRKKIKANDNRYQQLIYHVSLVKQQKNFLYILFGNGRSVHYGEMIMEMELLSILFNFGIIGFILYVGPFIYLIIKNLRKWHFKEINVRLVMNLAGVILAFGLSLVAGYVFFSSTCMLVLAIIISSLSKDGRGENL